MASDKDIRRMIDEHFLPFFEEGLPELMNKLDLIDLKLSRMEESLFADKMPVVDDAPDPERPGPSPIDTFVDKSAPEEVEQTQTEDEKSSEAESENTTASDLEYTHPELIEKEFESEEEKPLDIPEYAGDIEPSNTDVEYEQEIPGPESVSPVSYYNDTVQEDPDKEKGKPDD